MARYAVLIGCAQNDARAQADIAAPSGDASTNTDSTSETEAAERSIEADTEKARLLSACLNSFRSRSAPWLRRGRATPRREKQPGSHTVASYHTVNGRDDWPWLLQQVNYLQWQAGRRRVGCAPRGAAGARGTLTLPYPYPTPNRNPSPDLILTLG